MPVSLSIIISLNHIIIIQSYSSQICSSLIQSELQQLGLSRKLSDPAIQHSYDTKQHQPKCKSLKVLQKVKATVTQIRLLVISKQLYYYILAVLSGIMIFRRNNGIVSVFTREKTSFYDGRDLQIVEMQKQSQNSGNWKEGEHEKSEQFLRFRKGMYM